MEVSERCSLDITSKKLVQLRTKAQTLQSLQPQLTTALIMPLLIFSYKDWQERQTECLELINQNSWQDIPLAIRSSATTEDTQAYSNAGKYLTLLNINGLENITSAIDQVFASYGQAQAEDEVLIQECLQEVLVAGVVFTVEPNTGADYTIINYDDHSGTTDAVTAGKANTEVFMHYNLAENKSSGWQGKIIALAKELQILLAEPYLDIEFAISKDNSPILLQVRKLFVNTPFQEKKNITNILHNIAEKIDHNNKPHPYLSGKNTIYGVMPDWNPAEIIGLRPKALALSLYQELVTDNIWAYQRDNYGYKNLRSFPLMVDFCGLPYIDTRVSFNSFIPKTLPENIADKLVNYYLNRLEANPSLHDKVEFEIVFSSYTFDLKNKLDALTAYGFTSAEQNSLFKELINLTNNIIHNEQGLWRQDLQKIEELKKRHQIVMQSELPLISKIYWLLEDCKRYGTLPFAGLARASFIGVQILKSMVAEKIISEEQYHLFMSSVDSVSSQMAQDFNTLHQTEFLEKYGHLRPGTYDILSPRYDAEPDRYFEWTNKETAKNHTATKFTLSISQLRQIQDRIKQDGLSIEVLELLDFIKTAAELREYSKFVFTKNISDALELINQYGQNFGFSRQDCAYINIRDILYLYSSSADEKSVLSHSIASGKEKEQLAMQINLPPLLLSKEDAWSYKLPNIMPNFITNQAVQAKVQLINVDKALLANAIVFIPSADPGYDWLFSHKIAGFVTKFGGANSHMAIRANELGIPAVIGAGEVLYNKWSKANVLQIDCQQKQVLIIQ